MPPCPGTAVGPSHAAASLHRADATTFAVVVGDRRQSKRPSSDALSRRALAGCLTGMPNAPSVVTSRATESGATPTRPSVSASPENSDAASPVRRPACADTL